MMGGSGLCLYHPVRFRERPSCANPQTRTVYLNSRHLTPLSDLALVNSTPRGQGSSWVEGQGWLIGLGSAAQRAVAEGPNTYEEKALDCALEAASPVPPPCGPRSESTTMKRKAASATQLDRLSRARRPRSDE